MTDGSASNGNGLMIEVEHLTKRYAAARAVNDVSFTVQRGEIVGLLGPNGAGKSTIMRVLSCFTQADEVRRRIGYMPENNPLHRDLRVREYLQFRASLKGLRRGKARERVDTVMQQCGLTDVRKRIIGQLSKGYQQRVGLADALIHEPDLIILDEPTIGLDPNQIRAVRQLIKDLAGRHTVLISTHILPEVEMTCSRVLILRQGRILAADTPENLQQVMSESGQVVAEIVAPLPELQAAWEAMADVERFDLAPAQGDYVRCSLTARPGVDLRAQVFELVCARGWPLRELTRSRYSLEDIFVQVTRPDRE